MNFVRPKKNLGQHFLTDLNIARKIVDSLSADISDILEIGPGMGVLTQFLLQRPELNVHVIEIDTESVDYLKNHFSTLQNIYSEDFLKADITTRFVITSYSIHYTKLYELLCTAHEVAQRTK